MTYDALSAYLRNGVLAADVRLVTGHPAPDTDAVVSALFEAWRLTLRGTPALPVVQGTIPREAAWLLGGLTLPAAEATSTATWVLTDHHEVERYAGSVVSVVDHHPLAEGENLAEIDACIAPVGAATTLVAQRLKADGFLPDAACARILLGAILLDTEGLSPYKAKAEDLAVVEWLTSLCDEPPMALYQTLKDQLLSESDVTVLYERDWRCYAAADGTPVMGFAILKVWQDRMPDRQAIRRRLAQDAARGGYAATVAKIVLYAPDDRREEHYLAAGPMAEMVLTAVQTHSGPAAQRIAQDEVYLPVDCHHWGRKRYAVHLLKILQEKS